MLWPEDFQTRVIVSVAAFALFSNARVLARSKTFYYVVGIVVGVVVGFYVLGRNRGRLENIGAIVNLVGAATFAFPWIDPQFKFAYAACAGFCGFCAAHVHLHDFTPDSPYADVARWILWIVAFGFACFGVVELNVAFGASWIVSVAFARFRRVNDIPDTDSEISEPTSEEIERQRIYYEEGRRNAVIHMKRILRPNELRTFLDYVES